MQSLSPDTTSSRPAYARDGHGQSYQYRMNTSSDSPPQTPQQQIRGLNNRSKTGLPPSSYPKSARLAAVTGDLPRRDEYGSDARDNPYDNDDPHGLTYFSKHIPRASMVDNMVLALDQFSISNTASSYQPRQEHTTRPRGHTSSSSLSSESDLRSISLYQTHSSKASRRTSLRHARDPTQLPSIFGEDEDSTRVKVYEAQRAVLPDRSRSKQPDLDKMMEEVGSDHDLSHLKLLQGKLGPAGNRRSRSFDFGSSRREESEMDNRHGLSGISKVQTTTIGIGRRNSVVTARDGKTITGLVGSASLNNEAFLRASSGKASPINLPLDSTTATRRGFFSRFLGAGPRQPQFYPPQTTERPSMDPSSTSADTPGPPGLPSVQNQNLSRSGNKENQPPLTSKKSHRTFFGRKRRPSYESVAAPKPLVLNNSLSQVRPGEPSPISSLKAFMDPYLVNEDKLRPTTSPTSPLRKYSTPEHQHDSVSTDAEKPPVPPQKDTPRSTRRLSQQRALFSETRSKPAAVDSSLTVSTTNLGSRSASSQSTYITIRPVDDATAVSCQSTKLGIPPRGQSLAYVDTHTAAKAAPDTNQSGSDVSEYKSAPSTPLPLSALNSATTEKRVPSPRLHVTQPSISTGVGQAEMEKAKHIYDHSEEDIDSQDAAAWLGEAGPERERVRKAYMSLYDWTGHNILAALRGLCSRMVLKGESQQIDRLIDAFSHQWCQCNPNHGFRSADVVHTICYSILLLNTDLHMADISSRMTRTQFVKNSMQTIRPVAAEMDTPVSPAAQQFLGVKRQNMDRASSENSERTLSTPTNRPVEQLTRTESSDLDAFAVWGPLVEAPFSGSEAGWEAQIEHCLKDFYTGIQQKPLPLFGSEQAGRMPPTASSNQLLSLSGLRRTPSVISNGHSGNSKSLGSKWARGLKNNSSRPRLGSTPGFGSSKNSLDDQSSTWSPGMSSTWSKSKTLTSVSVDSFGTEHGGDSFKKSIGFASALSQAIIREDQFDVASVTDAGGDRQVAMLEDESLELEGAPWAKEGIVKHKCHFESADKKAKDRAWTDTFAVVEKGMMRLFSFSMTAKSLRAKAKTQKNTGVVGGGNWQDNAEELYAFKLRHTIASALPPPGYSKSKPNVWALTLPTGAVHLFSVGTQDIVKEFVSTANFWSARLSKEPMVGGVTSMEYGWSDGVVARPFGPDQARPSFSQNNETARPSTQMSMRSSLDHNTGSVRPRLPGDKVYISDWTAPHYSLLASTLAESEQLKALQSYVSNVEEELQKHNELRAPMLQAFSAKHPNHSRAMGNWERKSNYLLKEIVKFKEYTAALQAAQTAKESVQKRRREEDEARMRDVESMAFYASTATGTTA